jgi:hypothetical protein
MKIMKNNILVFTVIGFIVGIFLTGCGKTSEQKVADTKENTGEVKQELKNARTGYLAEWQTFKRDAEQAIAANEKRIDTLKIDIGKVDSQVKAKYRKDVAALEQANRGLKKNLKEYKDEGQDKWETFKTNFNHDLDGIGKTIKDLFKDHG